MLIRSALGACFLLCAATLPAQAETCRATFVRLFTERYGKGPLKIHVTQEVKGGMTTKNYNYQTGDGDWMSEMIEPAAMQWTLVRDNVMYTSSTKGKSWKKVRKLDDVQSPADVKKNLEKLVSTVENEVCGVEEIDGIAHDTIAADYANTTHKSTHKEKFWVNKKTGWVSKATSHTEHSAYEMLVTQVIEPAPGLTLPSP
ncbi:MAG: hypothetical protein RIC14_14395 [Filomicrobium sp.]